MSENKSKEWKLTDFRIQLRDYGEYKGQYIGKIEFRNQDDEGFICKIASESHKRILNIIAGDVRESAGNLMNKLKNSLND